MKKTVLLTAGAIVINNQKVLLVKRPADKKVFPGYWTFPGGKLKENETLVDCVYREFKEETGGNIACCKAYLFHEFEHDINHVISHLFWAELEGKIIENKETKWFDLEEAIKMDLAFEYHKLLREIYDRQNEGG